ncbi:MAG: hypothetical protein IPN01_19295 [Deltaproteobacteria bacterium]|nr:hypothetical protein [Deltaproteobacteria bacterium]
MATPSQLRLLEQLLSSSFSPAQLYQLLYGLFGQSFVGSLPPHQYIPAAQFFFEVVQRLEMNGYLLNNKMGQSLFAELGKERPGRGDDISKLAGELAITLPRGGGGEGQQSPNPPTVAAIDDLSGMITAKANHAPQVCLRVNIAKGQVTAAWQSGDRRAEDLRPTCPAVDAAAQQKLIQVTRRGGPAAQIAEASSPWARAHPGICSSRVSRPSSPWRPTMQQGGRPWSSASRLRGTRGPRPLTWELLREPDEPTAPCLPCPRCS